MKNLLERMKAEPLAKFNEAKEEYPKTIQDVEFDLKNNIFEVDLKYGSILYLHFFDILDDVKLSKVKNLFHD